MLSAWEIATVTENNGEKIIPDVDKTIEDKLQELSISKEEVSGIGVGVPGAVDTNGIVNTAVNLGWGVLDIPAILGGLTGIQVKAGNDANVAALGEMWKGGGVGHQNLVAVTLGTGVGGGIIINGEILAGCNGAGGEIGHIHVQDGEEEACGCGNKGCLEQYTSATGIVRLASRKLMASQKESSLRDIELTAKSVFDAVKEKDELAMEVAEEFGEYLGKALAAIACVTNPEIFVIGGGVSKAGEVLLDYIKKYYEPAVFFASRNVIFALATLGNDAGIYGAARMVL